jgi:L-ascorbate metabolism protein UlaG (beta-lactamase superfamily)
MLTWRTLFFASAAAGALVACKRESPAAGTNAPPSATSPQASGAPQSDSVDTIATSAGPLRIVPLRHATLLFEWAGRAIYVDPSPEAKYDGLPKADLIFITDIHGDHMSPPTVASLLKPQRHVVVPPAVASNLPPDGLIVVKNGETRTVPFISEATAAAATLGIEAVPMYNLVRGPSAGQLYHDKGRGNGYVLLFGDKRIYLSGDTECTPEMKALKNIDVAFVCMNLPYTMPPAEAAECVKAFQPKIVYPYHYRGSNLDEFNNALADQKGVEVRIRNWYP